MIVFPLSPLYNIHVNLPYGLPAPTQVQAPLQVCGAWQKFYGGKGIIS